MKKLIYTLLFTVFLSVFNSQAQTISDIALNPQSAKKYNNKGQEPDEVLALFIASLLRPNIREYMGTKAHIFLWAGEKQAIAILEKIGENEQPEMGDKADRLQTLKGNLKKMERE